ncbi:unnamed protein product, partial [Adineta ricciae]
RNTIDRIERFASRNGWTPFTLDLKSRDIIDWLRTVRPVYRCGLAVLTSILLHEHVMSRATMENFKKADFLAFCIAQHTQIMSAPGLVIETQRPHVQKYIAALINAYYRKSEFSKTNFDYSDNELDPVEHEKILLSQGISPGNIKLIFDLTVQITKATIRLHTELRTNQPFAVKPEISRHVLGVLGSHVDYNCDDIVIVFKRDVLHHVDANFSIQPFVSYQTGAYYQCQPWLRDESSDESNRMKLFNETKLHAAIPGYEQAAAIELIGLTSYGTHGRRMDIDLNTILDRWLLVHPQNSIETRLPQRIPLDYIDEIFMTQSMFESFENDIREKLNTVLGGRLQVVPIKENDTYRHSVITTLLRQHLKKNDLQSVAQGLTMTIPPTNFLDNLLTPIRISDLYEYDSTRRSKGSKDKTYYIYWQISNGDMMLTLSKKQDNPNDCNSRTTSLLIYIAEKPNTNTAQYRENPSYLNLGQPYQHQAFIDEKRYVARSTSFYRGCNLNDFITFCLEVQPSNNTVNLSHAGPNSIYNHEVISAKFQISTLDVADLELLYVSTGKCAVTIQNLFVTLEKQERLHPQVDLKLDKLSSFALATSRDNQAKRDLPAPPASPFPAAEGQEKQPIGFINQVRNAVGHIGDNVKGFVLGNGQGSTPLKMCKHGINCLIQFSDDGSHHNSKYLHPCRFADRCREHEPHLTHDPHPATVCLIGKDCNLLADAFHRAKFYHSGLPYFLIPCKHQAQCVDKSERHRIKYSHGEKVLERMEKPSRNEASNARQGNNNHEQLTPCRHGADCRDKSDQLHCRKYSHPSASVPKNENKSPYATSYYPDH